MRLRPLILTEDAKADLGAIRDYLAQHSEQASADYAARFARAFDRLRQFPAIGRPLPRRAGLRLWVVRPYVVVYADLPRGLTIIRVGHGSQDLPALLGGR